MLHVNVKELPAIAESRDGPGSLRRLFWFATVPAVLAACGDSVTGPEGTGTVSVAFQAPSEASSSVAPAATVSSAAAPVPSPAGPASFPAVPASPAPAAAIPIAFSLTVSGPNGTLTLDELLLIVDEFKLEAGEEACEMAGEEGEDAGACARFEAAPHLLALPLDEPGEEAVAVTEPVPAGSFADLKFEVKEADEDGSLLAQIRTEVPDWPGQASGFVAGSFAPADGSPAREFRAFFQGEVKVELSFETPLAVAEGSDQTVLVTLDPREWFTNPDGTVLDLSEFDFTATGEAFGLEVKLLDGFTKIEIEG